MKKLPLDEIASVNVKHNASDCSLEIALPKLAKQYRNRMLWNFILFELCYQIPKKYQIFYRIEDALEAKNYSEYPDSIWKLEQDTLSFTSPYPKQVMCDFWGGLWSYNGLLKFFCCSDDQTLETYYTNYLFTLAPFNDGESIEIRYTSHQILFEINQIIQKVIEPYGISIDYNT